MGFMKGKSGLCQGASGMEKRGCKTGCMKFFSPGKKGGVLFIRVMRDVRQKERAVVGVRETVRPCWFRASGAGGVAAACMATTRFLH